MQTAWLISFVLVAGAPEAEPGPFPPGAKLEKLWGEGSFTEGPAHGPGGVIFFSDIGNRIMQFDPATGKTIARLLATVPLSRASLRKRNQY